MWPFRKKVDLYGFVTDQNGQPVFEFTAEERRRIDEYFSPFEGVAILNGYQDRIRNLTIARALSEYADQAYLAAQESSKRKRKLLVNKSPGMQRRSAKVYGKNLQKPNHCLTPHTNVS